MTAREQAVTAAVRGGATRPAVIARHLNLKSPCPWCPVGPPKPGERCASVPRSSREAVRRVLLRLASRGLLVQPHPGTRLSDYVEARP